MPLTIRGDTFGSIKWSYQLAATIRPWTLTKEDDGRYTLSGTVVESNAVRLSQQPLTFVAPVKGAAWRFPVIGELQISGVLLNAILGPREVPSVQPHSSP